MQILEDEGQITGFNGLILGIAQEFNLDGICLLGEIDVWIFEHLTDKEKETIFRGKMIDLENKKFSDLSVMVIDQNKRETYLNFD